MQLKVVIKNAEENFLLIFINPEQNGFSYDYIFSNEETYKEFLRNKTVKEVFYSEDITEAKEYIKNNQIELNLLIEQTIPIYEINDISNIKSTENVILDISNLSWCDKLYIINNIANDKTYFKDAYTLEEILSLNDIKCMYMIIEELVKPLKDKSPVEQLYSIYALLKERPYLDDESEDVFKTRSLNQILYTNPIVCTGYANFFKAMCDALNITSELITWEKGNTGHSDNLCYINDSIYDIIGIFAMDITFDAEKKGIYHFLYPVDKEILEKGLNGFKVPKRGLYFELLDDYKTYLSFIEKNFPKIIINQVIEMIINKLNKIYMLLNIDYRVNKDNDIEEEIRKIKKYANTYISPFALKKIINIDDPEDCLEVIKTSFHYKSLQPEDKLMVDIFLNNKRNL